MREVGVLEAKTNLSALLSEVERGGEGVIITRHGKPIARLSAQLATAPSATPVRRLSGAELLARFDALHARMTAEHPEIDKLTWEEIRDMRDS